jgi:hypothetical protein
MLLVVMKHETDTTKRASVTRTLEGYLARAEQVFSVERQDMIRQDDKAKGKPRRQDKTRQDNARLD